MGFSEEEQLDGLIYEAIEIAQLENMLEEKKNTVNNNIKINNNTSNINNTSSLNNNFFVPHVPIQSTSFQKPPLDYSINH